MKQDQATKLQRIKQARERWMRRLNRAANAVAKLDRQEKRIAAVKPQTEAKTDVPMLSRLLPPVGNVKLPDDGSIPSYLQRSKLTAADEQAIAEIKAQQAEKTATKAKASKAKSKAKRAGDLRKMPLTGKAALDLINSTRE